MKSLRIKIRYLLGFCLIAFLSGCAMSPPQPELYLNANTLSENDIKIGIY